MAAATPFTTPDGRAVPGVTATEMAEVAHVAVDEVGLRLHQMMENAGRTLAAQVRAAADGPITVLAGSGGNGGGGLAAARHLANRGVDVRVVLDRAPSALSGPPAIQCDVLEATDVPVSVGTDGLPGDAAVLVDALVGYGLSGALREPAANLVEATADSEATVASLDVPSGLDATTGETPGPHVTPDRTVTLALPKTGLRAVPGDLILADIGIPAAVFRRAGIDYPAPLDDETVALSR